MWRGSAYRPLKLYDVTAARWFGNWYTNVTADSIAVHVSVQRNSSAYSCHNWSLSDGFTIYTLIDHQDVSGVSGTSTSVTVPVGWSYILNQCQPGMALNRWFELR